MESIELTDKGKAIAEGILWDIAHGMRGSNCYLTLSHRILLILHKGEINNLAVLSQNLGLPSGMVALCIRQMSTRGRSWIVEKEDAIV